MKKLTEMTDIGFKRTMTKIEKIDSLLEEAALKLKCKPNEVLERVQTLLNDIEEKKVELQKLKDKFK